MRWYKDDGLEWSFAHPLCPLKREFEGDRAGHSLIAQGGSEGVAPSRDSFNFFLAPDDDDEEDDSAIYSELMVLSCRKAPGREGGVRPTNSRLS